MYVWTQDIRESTRKRFGALTEYSARCWCCTLLHLIADSVASTSPSVRSQGAKSLVTLSRPKGGGRKGKAKRRQKAVVDPAPRTKEETLHLIKLRDEMISAKHQEVSQQRLGHSLSAFSVQRGDASFISALV